MNLCSAKTTAETRATRPHPPPRKAQAAPQIGHQPLQCRYVHGERFAPTLPSSFPQLHINGMSCSACSAAVERALVSMPGVQSATVGLLQKTAQVTYDPTKILKAQSLVLAVEDCGFEVTLLTPVASADTTQVRQQGTTFKVLSTHTTTTDGRAVSTGHALRSLHWGSGNRTAWRARGCQRHGVAAHAQGSCHV